MKALKTVSKFANQFSPFTPILNNIIVLAPTTTFDVNHSYPDEIWPSEWVECGVNGGTGEPLESSDGVFENKLPPNSETKVMGELIFLYVVFNN